MLFGKAFFPNFEILDKNKSQVRPNWMNLAFEGRKTS